MMSPAVDELLPSLGLQPSACPQYEYHGVNNFDAVLRQEYNLFQADNTRSQYIVFRGVTQSLFERDFVSPKSDVLTFESYFPNLNLLIVKMEHEPHSTAANKFTSNLLKHLSSMNIDELDEQLISIGSAHFRTIDRTKRADAAFRPRRLGNSRDRRWPSLVVEVGFTESYRKLHEDAKWWLTSSNNEVKTVVIIKMNPTCREVNIEKWIYQGQGQTIRQYRTVLSQEPGKSAVNVSNEQPFIIPFSDLFLRAATQNERDIVLSINDWRKLASVVWEVQFEQDYKQMTSTR